MIPRAEHPRPDWERGHWLNLNGAWDFAFSDAVICPELDRTITVPYSWAAPLSGVGEDVKGTGWYRRTARFDAQGRVVGGASPALRPESLGRGSRAALVAAGTCKAEAILAVCAHHPHRLLALDEGAAQRMVDLLRA